MRIAKHKTARQGATKVVMTEQDHLLIKNSGLLKEWDLIFT